LLRMGDCMYQERKYHTSLKVRSIQLNLVFYYGLQQP